MKKILKTETKIRFQDCDPFNHLNNAKYIDYFLNVREDQLLEHYNLSIFETLKSTGKSWVVTSNQISYIKPATTMEMVVIESHLINYTDKTLLVEMKMWNQEETELKAILWIRFIHYNVNTKRVSAHDQELTNLFESIMIPNEQTFFEERCQFIVQKLKTIKN